MGNTAIQNNSSESFLFVTQFSVLLFDYSTIATSESNIMELTLETQIYMLSGVFGGLLLLLALVIMGLAIAVLRISNSMNKSSKQKNTAPSSETNRGYQVENEDLPPVRQFAGDQELADMGFEMYSGPKLNRPQPQ